MKRSQHHRKPHRFKRKKPILRNRFFWRGIFILIFIISLFYFLFLSEIFQVKKINITGLEKISEQDIRIIAEKNLETKLLFFRTKSIFLASPAKIKNQLSGVFPKITELKVSRRLFGTINIVATERKSLAVWCQQEKCYSLDKEGVIFEENQRAENFINISDEKNTKSFSLGEKVIEKDELDNIFKIQKNLNDQIKTETNDFIILNDRLTAKTAEGWEIYFNQAGDIDWQLTKLSAVLEEKIPSEKRKGLEYIELRFGNLAPFKYR